MSKYKRTVQVVEDYLKIGGFIDLHKDAIFRKLEEHHRQVGDESESPLLFIAEALPLVSGIINVGCTVENFREAVRWLKSYLPDADPFAILATLTLIYILEKGRDEFADGEDEDRRVTWNRMAEAVLMQVQCA